MKMINTNRSFRLKALLITLMALATLWLLPTTSEAARLPDPQPVANPADCFEANIFYGEIPPGHENSPVLVFVHGYSGKALDWWFFNFSTGLNDMYEQAYNAGYRTAFLDVNIDPANPTCETPRQPVVSIFDSGEAINRQLEYILQHYGVDKVDVIAHSKGGVDTQAAIIFAGADDKIRNVFTLSSPHQGELLSDLIWSELGDLFGDLVTVVQQDEGTRSLRISNMTVFRLYADEQPVNEQINYFTAAGTGWQGSGGVTQISGLILQNLGYDNDGIVTVDSATLPYGTEIFLRDWSHAEMYQGYNAFPYIEAILRGAPSSVSVAGPAVGAVNSDYTFTATAAPITLTRPITFTWSVTGQPTLVRQSGLEDAVSFSWTTPGSKNVTVTASNRWGTASQSFTINIQAAAANKPPTSVAITGPTVAAVDVAHTFTAAVLPIDASQEINYTWEASDLPPLIHNSGATDSANFTWTTSGVKEIVVTASNDYGLTASAVFTVDVGVPPSQVSLQAPLIAESETDITLTASVTPLDVSGPITYTWRAVDHDEISQTFQLEPDLISNSQVYNWEYNAPQTVAVLVENKWGRVVDFVSIEVVTSPDAVNIEGPTVGVVNTTYDFTAVIDPIDATGPLTYTWQSTGNPASLVHTNDSQDVGAFTWSAPGNAFVAVIVENVDNFAPSRFDLLPLTIIEDSPNTAPVTLSVSGPESGLINTPYRFVAEIEPIDATQPVEYTWEISGRPPVTQMNGANDSLNISWDEGGTFEVTVTASNAFGSVSGQATIVIYAPITSVAVSGPSIGLANTLYEFTATAVPVTATQPVTYTWYTPETGQEIMVGGISSSKSYSWTVGTRVVAVTAENEWGWFTQPVIVEIGEMVTSVSLTGPGIGALGVDQTFVASVLPAGALTPITYTWSATNQPAVVQVGDKTDSITFNWNTPGPKTVTVTAVDPFGASVTQSFVILVGELIYTPLIVRNNAAMLSQPVYSDQDGGRFLASSGKILAASKPTFLAANTAPPLVANLASQSRFAARSTDNIGLP
ncbi:MAG: hypothetical protein Fur0021_22330 [Candidatus Promineifilaceae bacterium]